MENKERKNKMAEAQVGQVISCHSLDAWNEHMLKSSGSQNLVVVDFYATWCGPCRFIAPFLAEMAKKLPSVTFLKVDVDHLETVASQCNVDALPTFLILKGGKIVDKITGAKKEELQQTIARHNTFFQS